MSSLNDPFDLIETDKDMDNVIPFLAPNKINAMVDMALTHQQLTPQNTWSVKAWNSKGVWSGGLATAACIILLLTILSPTQIPVISQKSAPTVNTAQIDYDNDAIEFSELIMLDTWERY